MATDASAPAAPGNTWTTEVNDKGEFIRKPTTFRNWIKKDGSTGFLPEKDRYHIYVSYACPWAHRTLTVLKLKNLSDHISFSTVHWLLAENGWSFEENPDPINGFDYLRKVYLQSDPDYTGRITVPVLYDKKQKVIVSNESSEIIRMLNSEFNDLPNVNKALDLYPEALQDKINELNDWIYNDINNGVYKSGFARSQSAYEAAYENLFKALDRVEEILSSSRYLTGKTLTEADVRLWTTLVRFDPVYVLHFKCNKKRIQDYPNIYGYLREIYQLDGVKETVNMFHIKNHYFQSHTSINPLRIVPVGPQLDYDRPHGRDHL
eukprot:TRINITY_DN7620_c0_g1_i1.p1 TRINITY_DN7620_c0_g1~~TRINITY_DN7620_c0_g1_i1.p1  ORF type:complete len:320 (+),score=85.49 TRINITY_DN7620_c0_g1_i1:118-1077(+)